MKTQDQLRIQTVRQFYSGEEAERRSIAPEIVWHVPGHNPVSGDYQGFDAYMRAMPQRMAPLTRWDFSLEEVMVNGPYVMTIVHIIGERKSACVDLRGGHLIRLNEQNQIVEGWGFVDDQDALDAFFSV